VTWRSRRGD